jgi:DNA repair protein RadC
VCEPPRTLIQPAEAEAPHPDARENPSAARSIQRRRTRALVSKAELHGADALDTIELVLLVGGSASELALADVMPCALELAELSRFSAARLRHALALDRLGAARLAAAFALARRVARSSAAPRQPMRSPALVHAVLAPRFQGLQHETFHALLLDGKHRLRRVQRVSEGTLTSSLVHPREVFAPALRDGAAALIVAHNHPSGDPEPSSEDLAVTRRLIEVGALLGIPLLDHVVIAGERYVSLRERMRFEAVAS